MVTNFATEAVIGFFVLSGLVISYQQYDTIQNYIVARVVRIIPIYYIALVITIGAMLICSESVHLNQVLGNALFLQTLNGDIVNPLPYNLPLWSLSYEVFNYLMFITVLTFPRLFSPLFLISIISGIMTYFFTFPEGIVSWFVHIFSFLSYWMIGVIVIKCFERGKIASLETGIYSFMVGVCISRTPLSYDYFDFIRLLGFAIGTGLLCSALLGNGPEVAKVYGARLSVSRLNAYWRIGIATCAVAMLWELSPSLRLTKVTLTIGVLIVTIVPSWLLKCGGIALLPLRVTLIYMGGLSYALYVIHYPIICLFNGLHLKISPILEVIMVVALSTFIAHVLDYRLQHFIRVLLYRIRGMGMPILNARAPGPEI